MLNVTRNSIVRICRLEMVAMSESQEIFVRAHTVFAQKGESRRPSPAKWPEEVLVIDTETTLDTAQKLNFGVYRRCKLGPAGYQCVEEGLLQADDLDVQQRQVLERYRLDRRNVPGIEAKMFPPPMRLKRLTACGGSDVIQKTASKPLSAPNEYGHLRPTLRPRLRIREFHHRLLSRTDFVRRIFWKAVRKGHMVVGFNLPFDLSRLAFKSCPADKGGWSLVLSLWRGETDKPKPKTSASGHHLERRQNSVLWSQQPPPPRGMATRRPLSRSAHAGLGAAGMSPTRWTLRVLRSVCQGRWTTSRRAVLQTMKSSTAVRTCEPAPTC